MKKGLSVLLIAAALFGFYGGAVNLNDVLACKDYWEEEGEKSTADMNKLEDGLNQLKDNEQAYLDGLDAVAEGEEALAQGEQDYADGQATLAKGEADYAAAPGKLADARKQIAQGEEDLADGRAALAAGKAARAEGRKSLESLGTLISSMKQLKAGFEQPQNGSPQSLKDGYEKLKTGRDGILGNLDAMSGLTDKLGDLNLSEASVKGIMGAIATFKKQAAGGITHTNADYQEFVDALKDLKPGLEEASEKLDGAITAISAIQDAYSSLQNVEDTNKDGCLAALSTIVAYGPAMGNAFSGVVDYANAQKSAVAAAVNDQEHPDAEATAVKTAKQTMAGVWSQADVAKTLSDKLSEAKTNKTTVDVYIGKATEAINGYPLLSGSTAMKGRAQLAGGTALLVKTVYDSANTDAGKEMVGKLEAVAGQMKMGNLKTFAANMVAKQTSMDDFHNNMSAVVKLFDVLLPALQTTYDEGAATLKAADKQISKGEKDLAAGEKKLANGKKQYAKGLADYKAAPAKLAAGRAALAEGLQKLMDGRKELAAGKDKLAEYEDGEQQVRDGLATLMGTEPNGGLESILDRRSGDDDFDNGDKHLDLDEGLDAVDVGRGYQADSGELITKEITNRAIGTAAGLGAAALAVLAAILSFLKKNKGAGVLAILSAAAGGAGIAAGTSAGMEFSSIAGSAVGATPWIAFGILAAVVAVHAIAHFASKEA